MEGQYEFPSDCDVGTRELLEEVARLRCLAPANLVDMCVRYPRWSAKWRKAKEKTSSSHSGFHFPTTLLGQLLP